MNYLKITFYFIIFTLLLSCQSKLLTVHKIDVQQGNALDQEMIEKIELGMNKEQVHYVLGSPLITDSFHPDRWDYIYLFTPGYGEQVRKQLTLTFDRNEVININKHNITEGNSLNNDALVENNDDDSSDEEKLSAEEQEEQDKIEKNVETLRETLEENKNP